MKITQEILDDLTELARVTERLRMHLDLRDSAEYGSQRMLNAIEPGSILPIHRHQKTSETMVCLRGKLRVEYYDEQERKCTESFILEPNGVNVAVSIPMGMWHTVHALDPGTCILEMKNGPYEPIKEGDVLKI
jgi:cupin fold WbuC family metalloprotein